MPESETELRTGDLPVPLSHREPFHRWPRSARSLAAMAASALILTIAQSVGLGALVVLLFGGVWGLAVLAVVFVGTCAAVSLSLKLFTGRPHVFGAVFVTAAAAGLVIFALGRVGTVPMIWVPPGFDLACLLIGIVAALVLGAFLGPLWLRLVGATAIVGAVALAGWLSIEEQVQTAAQADTAADAQRKENFEYFLESGVHPLVADLPGSAVARVVADGGPAQAWIVTEAGAVVEIDVDTVAVDGLSEAYPCWWLAEPNMDLAPTDELADYADWCVKDAAGWARPDGTGYARIRDGRLIAVVSPTDHNVEIVEGRRPADAAEVAATLAALRPMTTRELRAAVEDAWLSGDF